MPNNNTYKEVKDKMRTERFRFNIIINILIVLITVGVFAVTTTAGYLSLKLLAATGEGGMKAVIEEIWYGNGKVSTESQCTQPPITKQ